MDRVLISQINSNKFKYGTLETYAIQGIKDEGEPE